MSFRSLCIAALAIILLTSPTAAQIKQLWSAGISDESYWYLAASYNGSALPTQITSGTFAIAQCRADTYDFASGRHISSQNGVCRPAASPSGSLGAIGYVYPDSNVVFNASGTSLSAKVDKQCVARDGTLQFHIMELFFCDPLSRYYPAYGSSVIATDNEVFVWGSRPLKDPSYGTACMFYAHASAKSLDDGPCIDNYGEGENAEDISLSKDGLVILLSAGFKLAVYNTCP